MTSAQGQMLRRSGLAIEALCMLGLLGLARGKFDIWNGFPIDPSLALSIGLGLGMVTWSVGTWAIYSSRRKSNER